MIAIIFIVVNSAMLYDDLPCYEMLLTHLPQDSWDNYQPRYHLRYISGHVVDV